MKKSMIFGMLALMVAMMTGCGGGPTDSYIKGQDYTTEGWLDDDTFQVVAEGAPSADAKIKVQRRTEAKDFSTVGRLRSFSEGISLVNGRALKLK